MKLTLLILTYKYLTSILDKVLYAEAILDAMQPVYWDPRTNVTISAEDIKSWGITIE